MSHDATPEETPQLHVDSDWKAEAERERERLAAAEAKAREEADAAGAAGGGRPGELPPADFRGLVGMLASQALMGLGAVADPQTGGAVVDLDGSRFAIDLLGVLEEKTAGNLAEEEATELSQALAALRTRYVEISKIVAEQMAAQGGMPSGAPGAPGMGGGMGGPSAGGIIDPTV